MNIIIITLLSCTIYPSIFTKNFQTYTPSIEGTRSLIFTHNENILAFAKLTPPNSIQEMRILFSMPLPPIQTQASSQHPIYTSPTGKLEAGIRFDAPQHSPTKYEIALKKELLQGPIVFPYLKKNAFFAENQIITSLGPLEQSFFNKFSQSDFKEFFLYIFNGHIGVIDEAQIINTYALYQFANFRRYLTTLKEFKPHFAQLEQELKRNKLLRKKVKKVQGDLYNDRIPPPKTKASFNDKTKFKKFVTNFAQREVSLNECCRERIANEHRPLQNLSTEEANQINEIDQRAEEQSSTKLASLYFEYDGVLNEEEEEKSLYYQHVHTRQERIENEIKKQSFVTKKIYNQHIQSFKNKLTTNERILLSECTGTKLQHHLHEEYIDLFDTITTNQSNWPNDSAIDQETIRSMANNGLAFNSLGYAYKASMTIDFCWAALDIISAIAEGIVEGGIAGCAQSVTTPLGNARLAVTTALILSQICGLGIAHAIGHEDLYDLCTNKLKERFDSISDTFNKAITNAQTRDVVKLVSAMATESLVARNVSCTMGNMFAKAKHQIPTLIKNLEKAGETLNTAKQATISGCQRAVAAIQASGAVEMSIKSAKEFKEALKSGNLFLSQKAQELTKLTRYSPVSLAERLQLLRIKVPQSALPSSATKDAIFNINHIFEGVFRLDTGRLTGLHHLTYKAYKKLPEGILKFTDRIENSIAKANIQTMNPNKTKPSTLFLWDFTRKSLLAEVKDGLIKSTKSWSKGKDGSFEKIILVRGYKVLVTFAHEKIRSIFPINENFNV